MRELPGLGPLRPLALIAALTGVTVGLLTLIGWTVRLGDYQPMIFSPRWTPSYQIYRQPHAVWLDRFERPGCNLPLLQRVLDEAANVRRTPELVIYAIPLRDLGQSSEGGFRHYEDYFADNRLNAERIRTFVRETGLHPIVYLEPDSIPLAVQYRRDQTDNADSRRVYAERIRAMRLLLAFYREAGARVYLEAGHSGWFDYADSDVRRIADALIEAGVAQADGLATNVSNRQPVFRSGENMPTRHIGNQETTPTEWHYLGRILPLLTASTAEHRSPGARSLDIRVDTSRNGGATHARQYYLEPGGRLWDNERPEGRLVGRWSSVEAPRDKADKDIPEIGTADRDEPVSTIGAASDMIRLEPFFGSSKMLTRLLEREKYSYDAKRRILTAPAWLDAVGDVQPGPVPTDHPPEPVAGRIGHYRYIKPPDDSDGALNYPPGASKRHINAETEKRQPPGKSRPYPSWNKL